MVEATPSPWLVPIVDLEPLRGGDALAKRLVANALGRAFEDTGFVIITGHGIDESLIASTYAAAKEFFAQPLVEKMCAALPRGVHDRGYLPIGVESVAGTLGARAPMDWCEALVFRSLHQEQQQLPEADGGWRNRWPERPAALSDLVRRYVAAAEGLAATLYSLAALALDLPESYFTPYFSGHANTLRLVNYPDQPDEPEAGQLRYGAHHDYGGLTVLRADAAPGGLQIFGQDGAWHDVPLVPGGFIVNIGELVERWTNGRWRSTLHRVVNPAREFNGSTQRLSIVFFSGPDANTEITCLPSCCDAARPARFGPVTAGDFVRAKLNRSIVHAERV
jgi:isopenicillin N synthase-like dioxygenase